MITQTSLLSNHTSELLINFVAFQLGWWCCVLGAANGEFVIGPFAVGLIAFAHLLRARHKLAELRLIICTIIAGAIWDSVMLRTGWIEYAGGQNFAPAWILALWAVFATTFNVSLRWLHRRKWLAALLGAIGAPLSYWSGMQLGAGTLINPSAALLAIGAGWMLLMPLLMKLAQRFDGYSCRPIASDISFERHSADKS